MIGLGLELGEGLGVGLDGRYGGGGRLWRGSGVAGRQNLTEDLITLYNTMVEETQALAINHYIIRVLYALLFSHTVNSRVQ